jgi:[ribosomal protein S18]-alanine N-acetyltransferase
MMPGYRFVPMDDDDAREISRWHYQPPYDFYDWTSDPDDLEELLDPARREDTYFSALDGEGALVGLFEFETEGETVDVGLGLRPDLTGKGLGLEYLLAGLEFAQERFSPGRFTLSVATFNERAIAVYERAGFRRGAVYTHHTNGADFQFLAMARDA